MEGCIIQYWHYFTSSSIKFVSIDFSAALPPFLLPVLVKLGLSHDGHRMAVVLEGDGGAVGETVLVGGANRQHNGDRLVAHTACK